MSYTYRLFDSISSVMLAARRVEKGGLACKIVPIPREFSSDCGVCLRTISLEESSIEDILRRAGTPVSTIHRRDAV
ncbi:MAG: DUF3343 domain-containing protein [Candidatus Sabulitectum sp.]|nr:DUF3343 domain-containing protein [Candidatus Sabulitectum sp.]